ncbi:MAG: PH domain-containing protein [Deltaproteobacteria bacterium]|nr:MAG: PH domain-containing protein [Deltaproteobacteria bacterium]
MAALTTTTIPGLALLPGERLIRQGTPSGVLRLRALILATAIGVLGVVTIPLLPVFWWAALKGVDVHRYWLTDRRVIVRTGIIGYRLRSIPLSRVADVSVQATWLDRLLGLTHVEVRDMTGESAGEGVSKGAMLLGVDAPGLWAESILARSGGALEAGGSQLDEMVGLLRALVAKAA